MIDRSIILRLLEEVESVRKYAVKMEKQHQHQLSKIDKDYYLSALNLVHYLAVRSRDLRPLQAELSAYAISSQGHSEGYTLNNLHQIETLLKALAGLPFGENILEAPDYTSSKSLLQLHTRQLFGKETYPGQTRIMVTLPSSAAEDLSLLQLMVKSGMKIARINTAHDDETVWLKMICNLRIACAEQGEEVKIYMDLAGPKLRTSTIISPLSEGKKPGILISRGDTLTLVSATGDSDPSLVNQVRCTLDTIFNDVKTGERIWLDDGKFGGRITAVNQHAITVSIDHAPLAGAKLRQEKGINLPDTDLHLPSLTIEDMAHLPFIAQHADMVGFSFVRRPEDIEALHKQLELSGKPDLGVILKIENKQAFDHLPALLLTAMKRKSVGLMIARGDLAVEIGFLRIAEVQEEVLWFAEAAHLPVIWATQVLDTFAKEGRATRAEISDAVKSVRAECVMLNKGPYIAEAIGMLKDIDIRMAAHESKKAKKLRSLNVASAFTCKS
jgi:pyruvate kinase